MTGKDFAGFVVVVTGGSTGLGRAICVEVASRGAEAVIINYARSDAEAQETAALVRAEGAQAIVVQGDVSKDEDCIRIAEAAAPFGRIDALFNNAGMTKIANHEDLHSVDADDFLRIYSVNVVGAFQMTRAARTLLESGQRQGAVVMTASIAGLTGLGSSIPYAASKAAMIMMTMSLARALSPKIRVNAVCPGYIDTPWFGKGGMGADAQDALRQRMLEVTPLQAASTPKDIAESAVFLASPASRHITGETLTVDAGAHLYTSAMGLR